jgi:hypothetical protein
MGQYRITEWREMGEPCFLIEQKGVFWGWNRVTWCKTKEEAIQWLDDLEFMAKNNVVHTRYIGEI